jgi:alanyl aminopeptidase
VGSAASSAGEWQIPVCVRWGDERGVQSQCALIGGRSSTLTLKAASCPAWVMPNADGAGYYRFAMAPADAARLEANFDRLDEREQRVYADSVTAAFSAGALDVEGFLHAASKLAGAPARETAMAPRERLEWMLMHLNFTAQQQQAVRDFILKAYGPRLAALGTEPRPGETDDDRLLRGELMEAMALAGRDPALRATLAAKGRRVLGLQAPGDASPGDGKLHPDAAAPDQRGLALRVMVEEGDAQVFDALLVQLAASQDADLRGQLLSAVGGARQPEFQARARALVLAPDALRRNEIALLFGQRRGRESWPGADPEARQAARDWLNIHFDVVAARMAPFGAGMVHAYADGLCSTIDADAMEARFAERLRNLQGGPRALTQAAERIRLCAALQARHQGSAWQLP